MHLYITDDLYDDIPIQQTGQVICLLVDKNFISKIYNPIDRITSRAVAVNIESCNLPLHNKLIIWMKQKNINLVILVENSIRLHNDLIVIISRVKPDKISSHELVMIRYPDVLRVCD